MKNDNPMKDCYGSYSRRKSCTNCVYKHSCNIYSRSRNAVDRGSGLVSFDNSVDQWYPAPDSFIPGYEEQTDPRNEMIRAMAKMLRWIMELDGYTLGIVAEIIAPADPGKGGVSVAHLARMRKCSRQAMHEKMVFAVEKFPELATLFQTALRRVGNLKSKFKRCSEKRKSGKAL